MSFASPNLLGLLLIVLPLVAYIGFPRLPYRRQRDTLSLILRSVLVIMIVLALAGLQVVRPVDKQAVVFLVDASDSMGADLRAAQLDYIRDAVAEKPVDDEWAVVVFGADVSIDKPFSNVTTVAPLRSSVLGNNTDLADAIQTAISLFPADARRRIVILSDGRETVGDATARARLAQASGVEISYALFARPPQPDVRISDFTSPAQIAEGQAFDITVTVDAARATDATLLLYSANQIIGEQDVRLRAGANRYTVTRRSEQGGFLNFSAQVVVPNSDDAFTQNNQLGTFSEIVGQPRVLLVANDPAAIVHLEPALAGAGVQVDSVLPANLPQDTGALALYESVLLVDVPAVDLSPRQQERLQTYVRELGGGLVVVGGPTSYGPGGYFQTTLADMLPLEMRIRDQQRIPQLTIAYLVDSSGSMAASYDGNVSLLDLAKQAIGISIDFLQPTDRAAVLTFDNQGALVAPFQNVEDTLTIKQQVGSLRPGGGTDIGVGVEIAESYMIAEDSQIKHLILMTDGGSNPVGLIDTAERLNVELGITTSIIGLGDPVPQFLPAMAQVGGGNFHQVTDFGDIPNILAQETVLATRSYIEEGSYTPRQTALHPILEGIDALPNLNGYVATSDRQTARIILRGPEPYSDPLLATWQYGLGRTVAFTSDATSRWATNWIDWDGYSRFWAQVVDYSITENARNNIETRVVMRDDRATVIIDARDEDGAFLNNLQMQTRIIAPDNSTQVLTVQQTAPGRYAATFTPTSEGSYFVGINAQGRASDGTPTSFNEITGWVMSYSPEYVNAAPNENLLAQLAQITDGQDLGDNPTAVFAALTEPRTAIAPIAPWLLLAALILLPFDIAVRRLMITRRDIDRLRAALFGSQLGAAHQERMSSLMQARQRARQRTQSGTVTRRTHDDDDDGGGTGDDAPRRPPPQPAPPAAGDAVGTVGNLLRRKRGASGADADD